MTQRSGSRTTSRDALVAKAVVHLSEHGPGGVQPQEICRELGISKALVNYHFGTREGLIAEATVAGYEEYVVICMAAADAAGSDPIDRLMAWIDAQQEWTSQHRGLAAAIDFPDVALSERLLVRGALSRRLTEAGARQFANLQLLVLDARTHLKKGEPDWQSDPTEIGLTSAIVGWLSLGRAVWAGGNHLPTHWPTMRAFLPIARDHMRTLLVEMLSR